MKKFLIYACVLALALGISSCKTAEAPSHTEPASTASSDAQTGEDKEEIIEKGKNAETAGMTKTFSSEYDINDDGITDNISLYVDAQKDENGILMMEDSHKWVLEVTDGITTYTLYSGTISNGAAYAEIAEYYSGDETLPTISMINSSSACLSVTNYTYNKETQKFIKKTMFSSDKLSDAGINMIASSVPDPEAVE